MSTYNEMLPYLEAADYDYHFWNAMRGKSESYASTRIYRN